MNGPTARRARVLLGAFLLAAPTLVLGTTQPAAAAEGVMAVEPSKGESDWGNIRLVTDRGCSAGSTNILVEVVGGNFPTGSFAVGNSELSGFPPAANGKGLVIPLFGSWDTVAEANGGKRDLDGTAQLTLLCMDQAGERVLDRITGKVRFDKAAGGPSSYQAEGPLLRSGMPYLASEANPSAPYVYRYNLPPGSPGGPPIGGPTAPPGAIADAAATVSGGTTEPGAAEGPQTLVPGTAIDNQATGSARSSGPSPTALIIGFVVLVGAATTGYLVYERARRNPPSTF